MWISELTAEFVRDCAGVLWAWATWVASGAVIVVVVGAIAKLLPSKFDICETELEERLGVREE